MSFKTRSKSQSKEQKKVTIIIDENIMVFKCPMCQRVLVEDNDFIIDISENREFKYLKNKDNLYYKCRCGAIFELLEFSSAKVLKGVKFKYSKIIEN